MAETVDELLVKLGLDVDQKSFQEADNLFENVKSSALQFGAALGVGFSFNHFVTGFANAKAALGDFAKDAGVAVGYIDKLDLAMKNAGGTSNDTLSLITRVNDLREQAHWGELNERAFVEAGFNPSEMRGMSTPEAIDWLAQAGSAMDAETRRRVLGDGLGFGQHGRNLFADRAGMQAMMQAAEEYGLTTQEMVDRARDFNIALAEMQDAAEGVSDQFSGMVIPELTELLEEMAEFTGENRDEIVKFLQDSLPYLKATATGVAALVALEAGRKGLGMLASAATRYGPLAGAAAIGYSFFEENSEAARDASVDYWARKLGFKDPNPGNTTEKQDAAIKDIQRLMESEAIAYPPVDSEAEAFDEAMRGANQRAKGLNIPGPGSLTPDEMSYEPSTDELIPSVRPAGGIRGRVESGEHTPQDYQFLRQKMRQFYPEQYGLNVGPPSGETLRLQASSSTINQYSIDARGATDPGATESVIRRVFNENLRSAVEVSKDDFGSNVA